MSGGEYDWDLVVIGGGSGGMAAAKEAAKHGAKVALFDYVKPSPRGSKWGLGGTCVNVGCVPKKLMHYAGLLGASFPDARHFGWNLGEKPELDWMTLMSSVQNQVKQLNFGYRTGLRSNQVTYLKALASFVDPHTIEYQLPRKDKATCTAKHIIIATGGRPYVPDNVPGAREVAITSDDIFSLKRDPGKTLCVGASYISLEIAGFLNEIGRDTTVAVRSILLRGFDRQCADKIGELMQAQGVKFRNQTLPTKFEKLENGRIQTTFSNGDVDEFDTVLYATGRYADTEGIGASKAGLITNAKGKFETDHEQTNVPHIYAIGDILEGKPELTPVAIAAGEKLARRLFAGATQPMDYEMVPTTVFTPFEYGCVGISEEEAIKRFGEDDVETYLFQFTTLELQAAHRAAHNGGDHPPTCLSKLVCRKSQNEKVVGFHFVGPNAGEITQGFALAVKLGATKADFDGIVGLHPTDAESFTTMDITRRSGENFTASGGCGGGKCG